MSPQAGYVLSDEIAPRIAGVVPRSIQPVGAEDHQVRWTPKTGPQVKIDFRWSASEKKADYESKTQTA